METRIQPIGGRAAWRPAALRDDRRGWVHQLTTDELRELDQAMATARGLGRPYETLRREDFALPGLAKVFANAREELADGPSVFLLKGVPIKKYTADEARTILWLIGIHLGSPVSQNPAGELIAEVKDVGRSNSDRTARGYQTADPLAYHNDQADAVGLLCLQPAKAGGLSSIVSAVSIHDAMLERHPELLEELYRPAFFDYRGEEPPGSKPYYLLSVFRRWNGELYTRYARNHARSAQLLPGVPKLSACKLAAFDVVDAMARSDEFRLDMEFEQGDIQFLNNKHILHSRTKFVDFDEPGKKRNLLRIWLRVEEWAFPDAVSSEYGIVDPQVLRHGIGPVRTVHV